MTEDDALARIGEAAREAQKDGARVERVARGAAEASEVAKLDAKSSAKKVASPWRRRLVLAAGPLALAAAMVVYVTAQRGPTTPELPLYTVTATGPRQMPGPAEGVSRLRLPRAASRNDRFELLLRPATAPHEKVVAYAFTFGAGGSSEPAPLEAKVEIATEGAVKLTGATRALEGASEIRVVVGAPAAIGKFDDAATRASAGTSDPHVHVLRVPIDRE